LFFFSECSCPHLDLHSFPTRRSSDLFCWSIGRWPNLDRSWGSGDLLKFRQTDLERLVHGYNLHTHLHGQRMCRDVVWALRRSARSEEHTSELQSLTNLVCRLLLEKKK